MWSLIGAPAYGMTLFFTLSGFVMAYNYFDLQWDRAPVRSTMRFAWLRFSRLYRLLFVFLIIHTDWSKPFDTWSLMHFLSIETWLPLKSGGYCRSAAGTA